MPRVAETRTVVYCVISVVLWRLALYVLDFSREWTSVEEVFTRLEESPLSMLAIVNMGACALYVLTRIIVYFIFGELRLGERRLMWSRITNDAVIKLLLLVFVSKISILEIVSWIVVFGSFNFIHMLSLLGRDRFDLALSDGSATLATQLRVLALLVTLFFICVGITIFYCYSFSIVSSGIAAIMLGEVAVILVDTLHAIIKYATHIHDLLRGRDWAQRESFVVHVDSVMAVLSHSLNMISGIAVVVQSRLSASLLLGALLVRFKTDASVVTSKIRALRHHRAAIRQLHSLVSDATPEDIASFDDACAICREDMDSAKKMPCGHLFHLDCLRRWLSQHTSCPTCRRPLNAAPDAAAAHPPADPQRQQPGGGAPRAPGGPATNAAAAAAALEQLPWPVRWLLERLPRVTVMVGTDGGAPLTMEFGSAMSVQRMVAQVREIFPNIPDERIQQELFLSRSVTRAVNNLLAQNAAAEMAETRRANNPINHNGATVAQPNAMVHQEEEAEAADGTMDDEDAGLVRRGSEIVTPRASPIRPIVQNRSSPRSFYWPRPPPFSPNSGVTFPTSTNVFEFPYFGPPRPAPWPVRQQAMTDDEEDARAAVAGSSSADIDEFINSTEDVVARRGLWRRLNNGGDRW